MLGPRPVVSAQFHFKVQSNRGGSSETAFAPRMPQCVSPRRRPQKVKRPPTLVFTRPGGRGLLPKPLRSWTRLPSNRASWALKSGELQPARAGARDAGASFGPTLCRSSLPCLAAGARPGEPSTFPALARVPLPPSPRALPEHSNLRPKSYTHLPNTEVSQSKSLRT